MNEFQNMGRPPERKAARVRILPRNWYSISASSGRRLLTLLGLGLLALAGYVGYEHWRAKELERRALATLQEADRLIRNLEQRSDIGELRERQPRVWTYRDRGWKKYNEGKMPEALSDARSSLRAIGGIIDTDRDGRKASIRFMRIEGDVEFRRGERGSWKKARANIRLAAGDWVKTSTGGKAELMFADGSVFTLRPRTMVHLPESASADEEGVADIAFGWVELGTGDAEGRVITPASEARIGKNSEALVSYDRDRSRGQFASYEGRLEVRSSTGEERTLESLQLVTQVGGKLSDLKPLPPMPELVAPREGVQIDRLTTGRIELSWRPVSRASRYALQVSTSRLFAKNVIDSTNRTRSRATLGLRGEGSFYWQVAAVGGDGVLGPWSETGSFQVIARRGGDADDRTPPELEVYSVEPYGSQVIVNGKTEPGSRVAINDETITIQPDGSFQKAVPVRGGGKTIVKVVATDSWGNEAMVEKEAFIEVF